MSRRDLSRFGLSVHDFQLTDLLGEGCNGRLDLEETAMSLSPSIARCAMFEGLTVVQAGLQVSTIKLMLCDFAVAYWRQDKAVGCSQRAPCTALQL